MERGMKLAVASGAHFLVDFSCAFFIFRHFVGAPDWAALLLIYNFCAFALQMPLGLAADRWNRNFLVAAGGCALVACGYLPLPPYWSVVLLGVGNAAFHVGGGLEVLTGSPDRCGPLGIFVSPGALGLYAGTLLGRGDLFPAYLPVLLMAAALVCLLSTQRVFHVSQRTENPPLSLPPLQGSFLLVLLGLFVVVVVRSAVGMGVSFPWRQGFWGLWATVALAGGKAAGGFLADRFGLLPTAAVSLLAAAALYPLSGAAPLGLAAVFLFNMTMPLTLYAAARLLPAARGLAFGLLTFALFLGFLPTYFGVGALSAALAAGAALASLAALLPGLRRAAL